MAFDVFNSARSLDFMKSPEYTNLFKVFQEKLAQVKPAMYDGKLIADGGVFKPIKGEDSDAPTCQIV